MQSPSQMFFPVNLEWTWHAGQDRGRCCPHHEAVLVAVASCLLCVNCSDSPGKNVDPRNPVDGSELRRSPLEVSLFIPLFRVAWLPMKPCWFQRFVGIFHPAKRIQLGMCIFFKGRTKKYNHLQNDQPKRNGTKINGPMNYGLPHRSLSKMIWDLFSCKRRFDTGVKNCRDIGQQIPVTRLQQKIRYGPWN